MKMSRQAHKEVEALAMTDGLTQVLNQRHFVELAEKEITRFKRYMQSFSLLIVDADYFNKSTIPSVI